jgi:hypothetical protein
MFGSILVFSNSTFFATFSLMLLAITNRPAPKFRHHDVLELAVEGLLLRQLHLNQIPRIPNLVLFPPEAQ